MKHPPFSLPVSTRVRPDDYDALRDIAARTGSSLNATIREAIRLFIDTQNPSAEERNPRERPN